MIVDDEAEVDILLTKLTGKRSISISKIGVRIRHAHVHVVRGLWFLCFLVLLNIILVVHGHGDVNNLL